jgi:hypothetical protein
LYRELFSAWVVYLSMVGSSFGASEQVVAHDHEADPGRPDVLLGAGVDQPEACGVEGPRQKIRGHVGHQRHRARVREVAGHWVPLMVLLVVMWT